MRPFPRTRREVTAHLLMIAWLVVIWLCLWGEVTPVNALTGLIVGSVVVLSVPPLPTRDDVIRVNLIPAVKFVVWFGWALVVSNISVAREVLVPRDRSSIRPAIVGIGLRTTSGRLATIIAHAITLTPGTLTVDARGRPAVLFVHVMSFDDAEATRDEVADLERRVVDAFGSAEERERICGVPAAGTTSADDAEVAR